ncbi:unnamed protein product [Meganyctiphanes norvegica]|uniref:Nuclear nucleic acid-binding protein C1D n=1 Tax=Meganyctiphanes norvegica TaxID=48144 RepID=A0AAV2PHD2_MEGNR
MAGQEDLGEAVTTREDFPPGMAPKILSLLKNLKQLEDNLKPLTAKPYHDILSTLSPLEKSKVGIMEVYSINTLYWVLMRISGEDVDTTLKDDYRVEMNRLKEIQSRLSEVERRAGRTRIDRQAAGRFIRQGLGRSARREEEDDDIEEIPNKRKKTYLGTYESEVKEEYPEEYPEEYAEEYSEEPAVESNPRFVESWQ